MSAAAPTQTLIAGVGYRNLRDLSFGPTLIDVAGELEWPPDVAIEDLSYGPIAVYQWFLENPERFGRAIFVAAAVRGRTPGSLYRYDWPGTSAKSEDHEDEVQARIGEALTGVIGVDNLLIICGHFGVLPHHVSVIEVEPEDESWGPDLTEGTLLRLRETIAALRAEVGASAGGVESRA